ncbi:HAD family hydrolase [Pseudoglutamicibacter cumminsii]|uniref:HAD family hydrolase n=1 Tax=Pseudoglutamicibacter cumminsii TaxID=156979 RepID=UPI0028120E04|nr:HAD-IB family phosphatase [Pseudoglutamicibacter cumminsii]
MGCQGRRSWSGRHYRRSVRLGRVDECRNGCLERTRRRDRDRRRFNADRTRSHRNARRACGTRRPGCRGDRTRDAGRARLRTKPARTCRGAQRALGRRHRRRRRKTTPTAGADKLIDAAHQRGWKVYAVSGGFQQILDPLAERLGLDGAVANHLEITDGALTGRVTGAVIDRQAKATHRAQWTSDNQIPSLGLGDGANDIDLLTTATGGLGLQPKPALRAVASGTLSLRRLDAVAALLGWDL